MYDNSKNGGSVAENETKKGGQKTVVAFYFHLNIPAIIGAHFFCQPLHLELLHQKRGLPLNYTLKARK